MPVAQVETRVRLASGEFVSVTQGEEVDARASIVAEFPALFGIKPQPPAKKNARKAAD